MASMTHSKRPRIRPRRAGRRLALLLKIDETAYVVRPLSCDALAARRAFQLRKPDGTHYDVALTSHGPECDCPDFIYRRAGLDPAGCKHIQALVSFGLIEPQVWFGVTEPNFAPEAAPPPRRTI